MTALPTRPMNSRRLMQVSHKVQDNTEYASKHGHHALTARGMIAWLTVAGLGQKRTSHALFKDFIGAGEDRMRHGEPERLSSLEIDYQLVLSRRLYRQIGGFLALKDTIDVVSSLPVRFNRVWPVGD